MGIVIAALAFVLGSFQKRFLDLTSAYFVGWFALYIIGATIVLFLQEKEAGRRPSFLQTVKFWFPKEIWKTKHGRVDIAFFLLGTLGIISIEKLEIDGTLRAFGHQLRRYLGFDHVPFSNSFATEMATLLFAMILVDIGFTLSHYMHHRIPVLWELHKVHHAPNGLTLFTAARVHPLEKVIEATCIGLTVVVGSLAMTSVGHDLSKSQMVIDVLIFSTIPHLHLFRHSHVWISYGRYFSYIFNSPAMHQIHHSADPKHWDKNFARMFSFLDLALGALYVPKQRESLRFGIPESEWGNKRYDTVIGALFHPLIPNSLLPSRDSGSGQSASREPAK